MDDEFRRGVGMVLVNKDKKVFVGKRNIVNTRMVSWFLNKPWQMPQGGIEKGETPLQSALRELQEEVGTDDVEVISETDDWLKYTVPPSLRRRGTNMTGQRQKWFLLKFLGEDENIDLNFTDHKEFDDWKWMSVGNVIRLSVHFKRRLYLEVFERFRQYFVEDKANI
ncbi:MAG: RNA pyrophosphohydrolase [Holosporales bacterium]|jgi:putative (di)nucleoside polyphosphate hydrolase|nr:RNA pyrophosphohydrolase [Holosporales bacterium]